MTEVRSVSADTISDRTSTRTACSYCGVGCGIVVQTSRDAAGHPVIAKVSGDKLHPTNFGRLCTKGATHAEMMLGSGRLESAFVRPARGRDPAAVATDEAVAQVAARLRTIIDEHGPDAVSLYVSGQMSIEAQYLANKLAKGFIRTLHIESNSRLCMASAGTGYKLSLGADGPPGSYTDFDTADLFFVIGSNMADCHPILYLRMADRLKAGAKLIVVDPRRTTTADKADLYLAITPGTDLALLNGLLHLLVANGDIDEDFIAEHTEGWATMPEFLADYPPDRVAEITGISETDIRTAARWIGEAGNWMTCWTMGLNQSTHGTWNTNAICNLHLATGAICRPGSGPMSLTGQPNAMGGREMGYMGPGLPGQRVAVSPADRAFVEQRWGISAGSIRSEVGPGTVDMFRQMSEGAIKACWIICTNPVASMANRRTVIAGLEAAELVVTQDTYLDTATNSYADVMLPATLWAESDMVFINSERNLTLLQQSIEPVGDARPDWRLIADVAAAMGYGEAFDYRCSEDVFDEIRGFWNPNTGWDLRGASYDRLRETPLQWPCPPLDQPGGPTTGTRSGTSTTGSASPCSSTGTACGPGWPSPPRRVGPCSTRGRTWMPPRCPTTTTRSSSTPAGCSISGHTMTKTGKVAKLNKLNPQPFVEVHPEDAERLGIADGGRVEIASRRGRAVLPAIVTDRVRPGNCFAPFHWNDEHGEYLTINAVTNDAVDPISLQPELKACAVSMRAVAPIPEPAQQPAAADPGAANFPGAAIHPIATMLDLPARVPAAPSVTEQHYLGGFLDALQTAPVEGVPILPECAPLRPELRLQVDGMLAGLYSRYAGGTVALPAIAGEPDTRPVIRDRPPVLVVWASQTGNAEEFAGETAGALIAAGIQAQLIEMDECSLDNLVDAHEILVVTSTFGDGGPPDDAQRFWAGLSAADAPQLPGTRFAVLGYGDSSYDDFCGYARNVDARLAELGGVRILDRVSAEPDDDTSPPQWLAQVTELLRDHPEPPAAPRVPPPPTGPGGSVMVLDRTEVAVREPTPIFTRANPIPGMLVRNNVLTGPGSAKEVRQFGFDLLDSPVSYQAGDALGVFPANTPPTIERFFAVTGLPSDGTVTIDHQDIALRDALRSRYDITRISPELLKFVAAEHPDASIAKLLRPDNKVELNRWLWGRHVVDLLAEHPVQADAVAWQSVLKRLMPRQYSISSSPLVSPREIQLTVSVVRYDSHHGQPRGGLCSVFLADHGDDGPIPIYLQAAPHFRVPPDPGTPMIMIGPGTGIAPFRGFLHERRAAGAGGRNWLFFGDQHAAENFYYRDELEGFFRDGFLTRLDVAFSRDQRQRIYVQDRMVEHGAELWRWLQDGAAVYVCGDASRMAKDVDHTLLQIIQTHGRMTADDAAVYRKELIRQHRYQRDVY